MDPYQGAKAKLPIQTNLALTSLLFAVRSLAPLKQKDTNPGSGEMEREREPTETGSNITLTARLK